MSNLLINLSNETLLNSYELAKEMNLDTHYIKLLEEEINRRKLNDAVAEDK